VYFLDTHVDTAVCGRSLSARSVDDKKIRAEKHKYSDTFSLDYYILVYFIL